MFGQILKFLCLFFDQIDRFKVIILNHFIKSKLHFKYNLWLTFL